MNTHVLSTPVTFLFPLILVAVLLSPPVWAGEDESAEGTPATEDAATEADTQAEAAAVEVPAEAAEPEVPAQEFRFQHANMPYREVIERFARAADRPLLGAVEIEGEMTFLDPEPYTYEEALDTLNIFLGMQGYQLMESGRFLRVVTIDEIGMMPHPIRSGDAPTEGLRPGQIVTVVLPVRHVDATEAAKALLPMVSSYGHIAPLARGMGVVVTDAAGAVERLREMLALIDRDDLADEQVKTVRLRHASARQVTEVLRATIAQQRIIPGRDRRPPREVAGDLTATFDERTNAIILKGKADHIVMAERLIEQLDQPEGPDGGAYRSFTLSSARASEVVGTINALLGTGDRRQRDMMPRVVADEASNRVIVSGAADQMAMVEALVRELDEATTDDGGMRIVRLNAADAEQIARIIGNALSRRDDRGRRIETVNVVADSGSNSLIIRGSAADIEQAMKLIEDLDTDTVQQGREIRIVQVRSGDVNQLVRSLRSVLSEPGTGGRGQPPMRITIEPDAATNSLLIAAAPTEWPRIERIIADLDEAAPDGADWQVQTPVTRLVPLVHAEAEQLAASLNHVFANPRAPRQPRGGRPAVPVVIAAQAHSNSLLISASEADQQEIARMIEMMDVAGEDDDEATIIVKLESADANELAAALRNTLPPVPRGQQPEIIIEPDARSNTILLRGPADQRAKMEQLIATLDASTDDASGITRTIPLRHARAEEVAPVLERIFSVPTGPQRRPQRGVPARPTEVPVVIAPSSRGNSLVVSASRDDHQAIAALIETLDVPADEEQESVVLVRLETAQAEQIAEAIRNTQPPVERGQRPRVTVHADARSNTVLVRAPVDERRRIEQLIASLDRQTAEQARETRLIRLQHASARDMAQMLAGLYRAEVTTQQQARGRRPAQPSTDAQLVVAPGPGDTTLVIEAAPAMVEQVVQLVESLDTEDGPGQMQVRTYSFDEANAAELATSLTNLFAAGRGQQARPGEVPPRFEADTATNQLMVAATADQFRRIDEVIETVQQSRPRTVLTRSFVLQHARAVDLVPVMESMLETQAQARPAPRGRRGPAPAPSALQTRVAAVEATNTLVVQGSPERLALAEELVETFDKPEASARAIVRIVHLSNAQAVSLANAVTSTLDARRTQPGRGAQQPASADAVTVTAEPNSNSVLVRGPASDVPEVMEMIRELDAQSTSSMVELRTFPLSNSSATELAGTLGRLFTDITRQRTAGQRDMTPPPFSVHADARTNSLVVSTTAPHFAIVEQLVAELDLEPDRPEMDVRYVPLAHSDAYEMARQLRALFADRRAENRPQIEADYYTNALTIIARHEDLETMEPVIGKLEEAAVATSRQVRVMRMDGIRAERMAELLQRIYPQLGEAGVVVTDQPLDEGARPQELLPGLNLPLPQAPSTPQGGDQDTVTPPLAPRSPATEAEDGDRTGEAGEPDEAGEKADDEEAEEDANRGIFGSLDEGPSQFESEFERKAASQPVALAVDRMANALIVSATRQQLVTIENLIRDLSYSAAATDSDMRIFKMRHADAAQVAQTVHALFNAQTIAAERRRSAERDQRQREQIQVPAPNVTAVAEPRTQSVIIRARPLDIEAVAQLIDNLDTVPTIASQVRTFPLHHASAEEVARNVREVFADAAISVAGGRARGEGGADATEQVRQVLEMQAGGRGDVAASVRISANRATNAVVVAAPVDAMQIVAGLIAELDDSAATAAADGVRMYRLEHAEVAPTVTALRELFPAQAQRQRDGAPTAGGAVVITGDEAGRQVIVSAAPERQELIASVIDKMDSAQAADPTTVRVYRIQHTDASELAGALTETLSRSGAAQPARRGQPARGGDTSLRINADRGSNQLIIRASSDEHDRIAGIISELDQPAGGDQPVEVIVLRHGDAEAIAGVLQRIFSTDAGQPQRGRRPAAPPGGRGPQAVSIEPDRGSNMLLVRADPQTFTQIRALALQLDASGAGGRAGQTVLALEHAEAALIAPALSQAFAPPRGVQVDADERVTIVPEASSNTLVVTANEQNLEKVKALLSRLDVETAEGVRNEFLILDNARATDLARTLGRVAANAAQAGGGRQQAGRVVVEADASSNALVMSGPSRELERILRMAIELDRAATGGDSGVYLVSLEKGNATQTAGMVRELYQQQSAAARSNNRPIDPLAVTADARANALILATTESMYEQVSAWVSEVEAMTRPTGTSRLIMLQHAEPVEVERALRDLYRDGQSAAPGRSGGGNPRGGNPASASGGTSGGASGGGGSGRVDVSVLEQQRALLINADDEDYEAILEFVRMLDQSAESKKPVLEVIQLKNASNTRVAEAVTRMYSAIADRAAPSQRINVAALPQSNAVVVAASEQRMDEVRRLIEQLDSAEVGQGVSFRIYSLEHAQPSRIIGTLNQLLAPIRQARPGEPITAQADDRTRSIILTAHGSVFEQVGQIIESLDRPAAFEGADVMVITLEHADSTRLALVLQEMLRPADGQSVTPEARALQEQVRRLRVHLREADANGVMPELDLTQPIRITADPVQPGQQGSNRLVITSTPDNLRAMGAIVDLLDSPPLATDVSVRLVMLEHSDAESVRNILREVFEQGRDFAGRDGTTVADRAEPEGQVGKALVNPLHVSADLRTNALVISGQAASVALAEALVMDLDKQKGEIVTEVRLFELKHADVNRLMPLLQAVFAEGAEVPGLEGARTQVTRLRAALQDEQGQEGGQGGDEAKMTDIARTRAALTIQGDPTTQILIVAARSDVMPLIAETVKAMDIPGAGAASGVRFVPLQHADATRLKQVLDGLYTGPTADLLRPEDRPTISVDTRTNALIIAASDRSFEVMMALLQNLDAKQAIGVHDVRVVALENAEAAAVAGTVQEVMDARVQRQENLGAGDAESMRVLITPDPRTNALIVTGTAESFEVIGQILEAIDDEAAALLGQVQLFPLEHANAGALATSLGNLFDRRYAAAATPDVQRQQPIILADVRTNALMVVANNDDTKVLEGLLERLDVELTDPAVQLTVIPLEHNDAGTIGPTIQRLFAARLQSMTPQGQTPDPQSRVDIATDSLANALIVSASRENLGLIRGLLEKVDVPPPTETGVVAMHVLEHADASRIATMLRSLISQGLYKPGRTVDSPVLEAEDRIAIETDTRTNALIISASKQNMAVIDEIVRRLDGEEAMSVLSDLRLYALERADATRIGPTLQQLFDSKRRAEIDAGGEGRALAVTFVADPRTNALLVAGSRESFTAVEKLLESLDGESASKESTFRILTLENATAGVVAPMVQQLFDRRPVRPGEDRFDVTVIPDARANALLIGATPEDMELVASMVERLDDASSAMQPTRVFPLRRADAGQVAQSLRTLVETQQLAGIGISIDQRTNALIVTGGEGDMSRIEALVERLDVDTVMKVTEIRLFALKNARATEIAPLLLEALTSQSAPMHGESGHRQTLLQFIGANEAGQKLIRSALQESLLITPDRRSNSLVVSAPVESMPLLEELIHALDSTVPRKADLQVFNLLNADARQMAELISSMFKVESAETDGTRSIQYTLRPTAELAEAHNISATLGTADQASITVTVDARTNSLIVGGTSEYIELAGRIISQLDESPAQERVSRIYYPRYSQATAIQAALRSFLDQERTRMDTTLDGEAMGAALQRLETEVAVVAEETSNALLISASPRHMNSVMEMVAELDREQPQVLIQVLLAEVTLTDQTDLGMDWNITKMIDGTTITGGADFGVQNAITQLGGFNVSVTGGDVSFFLQALQSTGNMQVLSRPQITAADNQTARIIVGQEVPLITASRVTELNDIINTVSYEDVSIRLEVTPRINPDGLVTLAVAPTVKSLSTSTVEISPGVRAPIINNRQAETTVSVQDGHTIMIGGLITTSDDKQQDKVPMLGDIPLLGAAFRSTRTIKERRELLIIMTPYVLRNVREADRITSEHLEHTGMIKDMQRDELQDRLFRPFDGELPTPSTAPQDSSNGDDQRGLWPDEQPTSTPRNGADAASTMPLPQPAPPMLLDPDDPATPPAADPANAYDRDTGNGQAGPMGEFPD